MIVIVVIGVEDAVVKVLLTPKQEQALLKRAVPLQALAYVGTLLGQIVSYEAAFVVEDAAVVASVVEA